jgi:predicted RNase H-like HicB family nuclease
MSVRSRKSSKKANGKAVDAPFDAKLWKRAAEIASGYRLIIEKEPEVGGYLGRSVEFPHVMADGPTIAKCAAETLDAQTLAVATMLEKGERPPMSNRSDKRTAQINIRVTEEEKLRLEEAAQRQGFRGISDYIRSAALKEAS